MTVREASDADVPAIVTLVNRAYLAEAFIVHGGRTNERDVRARLEAPDSAWLVIEHAAPHAGLAGTVWVEA